MAFLRHGDMQVDQRLAVGDAGGHLHVHTIPKNLVRPQGKEIDNMQKFLEREEQRVGYFRDRRQELAELKETLEKQAQMAADKEAEALAEKWAQERAERKAAELAKTDAEGPTGKETGSEDSDTKAEAVPCPEAAPGTDAAAPARTSSAGRATRTRRTRETSARGMSTRTDGRPAPASTPRRRGSWRRLERAAARGAARSPLRRRGPGADLRSRSRGAARGARGGRRGAAGPAQR